MIELTCPICSADTPLDGEEEAGDSILCAFCFSPLKMTVKDDGSRALVDDS